VTIKGRGASVPRSLREQPDQPRLVNQIRNERRTGADHEYGAA
jgi:hypothetical protein